MLKRTSLILIANLVMTQTALAKADEAARFQLAWKGSFEGESSTGERGNQKLVSFGFDLDAKYKLTQSLRFEVNPVFNYHTGAIEVRESANTTENQITLKNAAVRWAPASSFQLKAGALNQGLTQNSLLVGGNPFPAAQVQLKAGSAQDGFAASALLQAAMPTTTSLASQTEENETTPSLNTAAVRLQYNQQGAWGLAAKIGYFQWQNIPKMVAAKSATIGNSVNLINDSEGTWLYDYKGQDAQLEGRLNLTWLIFQFGADYLKNESAPQNKNTAINTYLNTTLIANEDLHFLLNLNRFRIESDATIAYFSSSRYFNTNRNGYAIEGAFENSRAGYQVGLRFTEADSIYLNNWQLKERQIVLKLETSYAGF